MMAGLIFVFLLALVPSLCNSQPGPPMTLPQKANWNCRPGPRGRRCPQPAAVDGPKGDDEEDFASKDDIMIPGYPKKGFPEAPGPAGWPSTKPPTAATKPTLQCTEIRSKGNIAACPLGYMVTGCACGMNCGLWNTQNNFSECSCHVSCNDGKPLEWAKAICCRVV